MRVRLLCGQFGQRQWRAMRMTQARTGQLCQRIRTVFLRQTEIERIRAQVFVRRRSNRADWRTVRTVGRLLLCGRCALAIALCVILQIVGAAELDIAQWACIYGILTLAGGRHRQTTRVQQQRLDDRTFGILRVQILLRRRCVDMQRRSG